MCGKCDNPEGNLCRKCEQEMAEIKQQSVYDDGWWPHVAVGKRSINAGSSSNEQPSDMLYV